MAPNLLNQREDAVAPWRIAALGVLWALIFAMRILGPVDLVTRSQGLTLSYLVDIITNGSWISAQDYVGDPASKPPLYNWLGALSVLLFGRTWFAAALPSALATLGTMAWLIRWGSKHLGARTGVGAALMFLLCPLTAALVAVVRPDALFTLCIAIAAGFAFEAWYEGRSWWPFWIWATLAGLAKGPQGLLLAAGGLAAAWVVRAPGPKSTHTAKIWPGLLFFLAVNIGWFTLAWLTVGPAFFHEVVSEELVGHTFHNDHGDSLLATFWQPTAYLLGRFLPWSVLLFRAIPRIARRPAEEPDERAVESFLMAWLVVGLFLFSIVGHKRADLVAPLIPAVALLVAREITDITRKLSPIRLAATTLATAAVLLGALTAYQYLYRPRNRLVALSIVEYAFSEKLADRISDGQVLAFTTGQLHPEFYYVPQYLLGTLHRPISIDEAVQRLATPERAWIVTPEVEDVTVEAARRGVEIHHLLSGDGGFALVSNQTEFP